MRLRTLPYLSSSAAQQCLFFWAPVPLASLISCYGCLCSAATRRPAASGQTAKRMERSSSPGQCEPERRMMGERRHSGRPRGEGMCQTCFSRDRGIDGR